MESDIIDLFRLKENIDYCELLFEHTSCFRVDAAEKIYLQGWARVPKLEDWTLNQIKLELNSLIQDANSVEDIEDILYSLMKYISQRTP